MIQRSTKKAQNIGTKAGLNIKLTETGIVKTSQSKSLSSDG